MMTDDDFKRLVTLYLEDAIGEDDRQLLNSELLDAPDRVRQFNDVRILAGMILEHGRSEKDFPETADFFEPEPDRRRWNQWFAAAALFVAGMFAGFLLSSSWVDQRNTDSEPGTDTIAAVTLIDGGFEQSDPGLVTGYPIRPGVWTGDAVKIVWNETSAISPCEGDSMLCFAPKTERAPAPAPKPKRVVQWQIVDLAGAEAVEGAVEATLCAQFNRDSEGPAAGSPCGIELYSFRGSPTTVQSQLESEKFLTAAVTYLQTDSDPRTWELAKTSLRVSPETDFLLLGISGFGKRVNQPGGERFSGTYADSVELTLSHFPVPDF